MVVARAARHGGMFECGAGVAHAVGMAPRHRRFRRHHVEHGGFAARRAGAELQGAELVRPARDAGVIAARGRMAVERPNQLEAKRRFASGDRMDDPLAKRVMDRFAGAARVED
jgi:hypothetical protein